MVRIRLTRVGRKKAPYYRIVVADARFARDGRIIESIGQYQPLQPNQNLRINEERALHWLQQGAQPSGTIRSLLRREGILQKFHEGRFGPSIKAGHENHHVKKERPVETGRFKPTPPPAAATPAPPAAATPAPAPVVEEPVTAPAAPESVAPAEAAPETTDTTPASE